MSTPASYLFWFFLLIITKVNTLMLESVKQPSCDELRLFWDDVNRARKMAELTNEIPALPWEALPHSNHLGSMNGHNYKTSRSFRATPQIELQEKGISKPKSQSNHHSFSSMHSPASLYSVFLPNQKTQVSDGDFFPLSKEFEIDDVDFDTFGNSFYFGQQSDAKRRSESSQMAWGQPHDVGSFGRFVDFGDQAFLPDGRRSKGKSKNWSDVLFTGQVPPVLKQKSCKEVVNKQCTSDSQCSCASSNLMRCVRGKCNIESTSLGRESQYGIWHDEALPSIQLGVIKRSRETEDGSTAM